MLDPRRPDEQAKEPGLVPVRSDDPDAHHAIVQHLERHLQGEPGAQRVEAGMGGGAVPPGTELVGVDPHHGLPPGRSVVRDGGRSLFDAGAGLQPVAVGRPIDQAHDAGVHPVLGGQHREQVGRVDVASQAVELEDVPPEPLLHRVRPGLDDRGELAEVAEDGEALRGQRSRQGDLWRLGHARFVDEDAVEAALMDLRRDGGLRQGREDEPSGLEEVAAGPAHLVPHLAQIFGHPGQLPAGVAAGPVLDRVGSEQGILAVHQRTAPALERLQPCDEFGPGSLQDGTLGDGERLCLLEERLPCPERLPPGLPAFGGPQQVADEGDCGGIHGGIAVGQHKDGFAAQEGLGR